MIEMKNPVGIYYAYWEQNWDADFYPYIDKVRKLGFDVLEINAGTVAEMSGGQRRELARAAADAGIKLTYCIGLPGRYDVSSADGTVRRNGIAFVKSMLAGIHGRGHHRRDSLRFMADAGRAGL